jgi:hypothetical protein
LLAAHGLIGSSFVPSAPIQELRDLTRTRRQLVHEIARHVLRVRKTLEDANLKLTQVMSDIVSVSGRASATTLAEASDIFWACSYGEVPAVLGFLEADASLVYARRPAGRGIHTSWVGRTPLHETAVRGEVEVGRRLIERGADVNVRGGSHDATPLHVAAVGGHRDGRSPGRG